MSTSVAPTIKQGGSHGSALKRLEKTSSIGKNRRPPHQNIAGLESSQESSEGDSSGKAQLLASDDSDGDSDEEFQIINPIYEHAGGSSGRFRADTSVPPPTAVLGRFFSKVKDRLKAPDGTLSVSVLNVTGLPNSAEARIRFSLNGQVDWSDSTKKMFQLSHFKSSPSKASLGISPLELNIEVNHSITDSFWGSAVINNVERDIPDKPTKLKIPLFDSTQNQIGELEATFSYHKFSISEIAGIRWRWLLDYPKTIANDAKGAMRSLYETSKQMILAGLPGIQGGAASWVVMGFAALPYLLSTVFTNWSWAFRQWILVIPLYIYISVSFPVLLGWLFGTLVTVFALHGYPGGFHCSALHITPWIKEYALQIRITGLDLRMGNPPGFPLIDFWSCKRADISGSISFRHLLGSFI